MSSISIVTFERTKKVTIPSSFEHWGIFVRYEEGTDKLYHADKVSLFNIYTKYEEKPWSPEKSKKKDCLVLVGYTSKTFNNDTMTEACNQVTRDRVFNTLTNNCQEWVKGVLNNLISNNFLAQAAFEELKYDSEITPLLGW